MLYFGMLKRYTFTSDAAVRVGKHILHTLKHNVDFRQLLSLSLCETFVFLEAHFHIRRCSARWKNIHPTLKHKANIRRCSARWSKEMYTRDHCYRVFSARTGQSVFCAEGSMHATLIIVLGRYRDREHGIPKFIRKTTV